MRRHFIKERAKDNVIAVFSMIGDSSLPERAHILSIHATERIKSTPSAPTPQNRKPQVRG